LEQALVRGGERFVRDFQRGMHEMGAFEFDPHLFPEAPDQ
jgi:hypothetical protein